MLYAALLVPHAAAALCALAVAVHVIRAACRLWWMLPEENVWSDRRKRTREQQEIREAAEILTIAAMLLFVGVLASVVWFAWKVGNA